MRFRYSEVQTYYKCQKLYEYKHVQELPDGSDKSADLLFGTAVHLGLQDVFEGGNGVDCFNIFWTDLEDKLLDYGRLPWRDLSYLGQTFIERFKRLHKKNFAPISLETTMEAEINGVTLTGTADMIGKYKDKLSIIDYKTSAMPYDSYKIECNEQMYNYAALASTKLGYKIEQLVYIVFVKNIKEPRIQVITKDLDKQKLDDMMENLTNTCKEIQVKASLLEDGHKKVFLRNPSSCVMGKHVCPFFNKCFNKTQSSGGEYDTD